MNTKVQEFINKMREEEKKRRNENLISLGLVDETKKTIVRQYISSYRDDAKYDKEKQLYYIEKEVYEPIEVTDEEYKEIVKYSAFGEEKNQETKEVSTTWANAIKVIANILFALSIIGGFMLWIILADSYDTRDFAWIPIASALEYCILCYPLIVGFSKIVAVAERKLQE